MKASVFLLACCFFGETLCAQEPEAEQERADTGKIGLHLNVYALASLPKNRAGQAEGNGEASVGTGFGGGYKVGFFPAWTQRMIGIEAEAFGVGSALSAHRISRDGTTSFADTNMIAFNTLFNLLIRYPGRRWQPYGGAGVGISSGYLRDTSIRHGIAEFTGYTSDLTYAYQFLAGLRGYVGHTVFIFTEYKYFIANYQWNHTSIAGPGLSTTLNFHTHLVAAGVGWSF